MVKKERGGEKHLIQVNRQREIIRIISLSVFSFPFSRLSLAFVEK
jgi:hypothetical protein